ncbi:MAG: HEAT repeat domain-containing protein [Pyrinomonadaceae bacterium]
MRSQHMPSSHEITLDRVARLASSGGAEDARSLAQLLGHEDWQTRRAAAEAIIERVHNHTVETYIDELLDELLEAVSGDSAQAGRRAAAITVLEGICSKILPRIEAEIKATPQPAVRIALAGIVSAAADKNTVGLLAPLAQDADTNVAAAVIAALGRTNDREATQILLHYSMGKNEWLRFAAVGALGELGDARAIPRLKELLEDSLMIDAAASALVEIASIDSCAALAGHLRNEDKTLRPAVLAAIVSLACGERTGQPRRISEAIRARVRQAFRQASDESTFLHLAQMVSSAEAEHARAGICALGWLGDARAVSIVAGALKKPPLAAAARQALADLSHTPHNLKALLAAAESHSIPAHEVALAINQARSFGSIEALSRLAAEASDAETLEACLTALEQAREWMLELQPTRIDKDEARRVFENVRGWTATANGETLVKFAALLGALARFVSDASAKTVDDELQTRDDAALARLAFRQNFSQALAMEEARRAQRHPNVSVRLSAIEILSEQSASHDNIQLAAHLTDESVSVRRECARALRRNAATMSIAVSLETSRALLASLADEDVWVKTEALLSLGALFGANEAIRARLRNELKAPHPLCRVAAAQALTAPTSTANYPHINSPAETVAPDHPSTIQHAAPQSHALQPSVPLQTYADATEWRALAQLAKRDTQTEVRRAVVLCFARCTQPRIMLSVARGALKDAAWPVRRAAINVLDACAEAGALKLLLDAAANESETATVRGAALRALARRNATQALPLACLALAKADASLVEDAFAALLFLKPTHRKQLLDARSSYSPRAATIIDFVLAEESETSPDETALPDETSGGRL